MADVENKDVTSDSLGDATHQEGTDYIKDKLAGKADTTAATEGTAPATGATESVLPETTTSKPEAITPAQPPASNPGADNPSAGIAKDAGGLSSAAHVQSPTATKEKRKSIVGQLTGFLGFGGGKKEKEARNASTDNSAAGTASGAAAGAAATAAGTTAVLTDRTKSTVQENTGIDMGAKGKETADTSAAGAETTTTSKDTEGAVATDGTDESKKEPTDTSGDDDHKPPKPAGDPKQMENRDAIPAAGGEKLGEKHWGESKIVPDNPKPKDEEGAGVASKDGQPSQEVSDNTAKNTGGATGGPSDSKDAQKKGKFMDKIKSKFNKDKA